MPAMLMVLVTGMCRNKSCSKHMLTSCQTGFPELEQAHSASWRVSACRKLPVAPLQPHPNTYAVQSTSATQPGCPHDTLPGSRYPGNISLHMHICVSAHLWWLGVAHSSLFGFGCCEFSLLSFRAQGFETCCPSKVSGLPAHLASFQESGGSRSFRKYTSLRNRLPSICPIIAGAAHNSVPFVGRLGCAVV